MVEPAPLSSYRVLADLARTVDPANTIITHYADSHRDQVISVLVEHRAAKQPRLGLTPPAASRRPSPRRSRPERTSGQATPPASFAWRRRLTRSIASGVPSWSVPNHRSHGMNGLP